MRLHQLLATCILVAAGLGITTSAHADTAADIDAARVLFKDGVKLAKNGDWGPAVERYQRSLMLHQAPITLYSLGVAYEKLGKLADALESYRRFLAKAKPNNNARYILVARTAVVQLEKRVSFLVVNTTPASPQNLVVSIDGRPIPVEAEGVPRLLDPGDHLLQTSAPGFVDTAMNLTLPEGANSTVKLALQPDGSRLAGSIPIAPIVTMGVGVAALASGIAVGLVGVMEANDAPTRDGAEAGAARDKMLIGDVMAGAGGTAAAVGLVWLLVDLTQSSSESASAWFATPSSVGYRF